MSNDWTFNNFKWIILRTYIYLFLLFFQVVPPLNWLLMVGAPGHGPKCPYGWSGPVWAWLKGLLRSANSGWTASRCRTSTTTSQSSWRAPTRPPWPRCPQWVRATRTRTHAHAHARTHAYIHTKHTLICTNTCIHTKQTLIYTHTCKQSQTHARTRTQTHTHKIIFTYICIYECIFQTYGHTHTHLNMHIGPERYVFKRVILNLNPPIKLQRTGF